MAEAAQLNGHATEGPTDADLAAVAGQVSHGVVLPLHRLVLGIQHREDAGLRVCAWDGQHFRHMSPAKARRLAKEYADSPAGPALKPVSDELVKLADKCDELALLVSKPEGEA